MYNVNVHVPGSVKRAAKRNVQFGGTVKGLTRAEAQGMIAKSTDAGFVARFSEHPNAHIQRYVQHKLCLLERKAKRSEAARKAAATRKAKRETAAA